MPDLTTPAGHQWTVRRRVLLWRPEPRWDLLDADDLIGVLLIVPLSVLVGIVLLPIELLLVVVLSLPVLLLRAVRLRPWRVVAAPRGHRRGLEWHVRGCAAAGDRAEAVAQELRAGGDPARHADRVRD